MTKTKLTPTPLLCDLDFHLVENEDSTVECRTELRFGQDEFEHKGNSYTISIRRALLSMDFSGYDVVPQSRYGEPVQSNSLTVKTSYAKEQGTKANASIKGNVEASAKITGYSAGVTIEADALLAMQSDENVKVDADQETTLLAVKAKGGDYWEITEPTPDGSFRPLNRTFLNSERLCSLSAIPLSNYRGVSGIVKVRSRDIEIQSATTDQKAGFFGGLSTNKSKVLKAFVAAQLAELSPANKSYEGVVEVAMVEVEREEP